MTNKELITLTKNIPNDQELGAALRSHLPTLEREEKRISNIVNEELSEEDQVKQSLINMGQQQLM